MLLSRVRPDFFQIIHGNLLRINLLRNTSDSAAGWIANILIKMILLRLTVRIHHFKCSLKNLFKFKCSNSMLQWKKIREENLKDGTDSIQESFQNHSSGWLISWPIRMSFINVKTEKVISNLPELKSNLDALKKFGVGLLEKGKKEIQNKNKQLRKEFEKNRKWFLNEIM